MSHTTSSLPLLLRVELLGDNQIKLVIGEAYRNYLDAYEITEYLDFGWLTNAFIVDYVAELAGEGSLTSPVFWQAEKKGRDRADKDDYKVKLSASFCFSNKVNIIEHYHNSSWLEHGGSPEKATKSAFVSGIDKYLRDQNKYQKNESAIKFQDVQFFHLLLLL